MNAYYQSLRQEADKLFHRYCDVVDDSAAGGGLKQEARDIVEWCEMEKNPHSIEDKIKHVHEELHEIGKDDTVVMDRGHVDELIRGYEELRESVHRLPNY